MRLRPVWALGILLLCSPALAAPAKMLIDAPQPLKRDLERHLGKICSLGSAALSAEPNPDEVSGACLEQQAVAVVSARLQHNL